MAKIGVSLKIDVSKIDKARLFKGQKGTYLDMTAFIDLEQLDQYGNSGMITQDVSKEEKAQGAQGAILGNSKVFWKDAVQAPAAPQAQQQAPRQAPQQAPMQQPQQYVQQAPAQQPQGQPYPPISDDELDSDLPF